MSQFMLVLMWMFLNARLQPLGSAQLLNSVTLFILPFEYLLMSFLKHSNRMTGPGHFWLTQSTLILAATLSTNCNGRNTPGTPNSLRVDKVDEHFDELRCHDSIIDMLINHACNTWPDIPYEFCPAARLTIHVALTPMILQEFAVT